MTLLLYQENGNLPFIRSSAGEQGSEMKSTDSEIHVHGSDLGQITLLLCASVSHL